MSVPYHQMSETTETTEITDLVELKKQLISIKQHIQYQNEILDDSRSLSSRFYLLNAFQLFSITLLLYCIVRR